MILEASSCEEALPLAMYYMSLSHFKTSTCGCPGIWCSFIMILVRQALRFKFDKARAQVCASRGCGSTEELGQADGGRSDRGPLVSPSCSCCRRKLTVKCNGRESLVSMKRHMRVEESINCSAHRQEIKISTLCIPHELHGRFGLDQRRLNANLLSRDSEDHLAGQPAAPSSIDALQSRKCSLLSPPFRAHLAWPKAGSTRVL